MTDPEVAKIGRWYSEMPTSSVAAERAFGLRVMRAMESKVRCAMSEDRFRQELTFRVNDWLLEKIMKASHSKLA